MEIALSFVKCFAITIFIYGIISYFRTDLCYDGGKVNPISFENGNDILLLRNGCFSMWFIKKPWFLFSLIHG